jgi:hypothetical protein
MRGQKEQIIPLLVICICIHIQVLLLIVVLRGTYVPRLKPTDLRRYDKLNNRANMSVLRFSMLCTMYVWPI